MAELCPTIDREFAYYEQSYPSLRHVGQVFAENFKEWAWGEGKKDFPTEYFSSSHSHEIFLKHKVSEYLESITPSAPETKGNSVESIELRALQSIRPHAIITTNYDRFLERIFPEYEPIIGQKILRYDSALFGEIFKIHGCVSDPTTLVLTESDYDDFAQKKKYLSAKLLTLFLEHPLLFVGYSAEDPNVRALLSDIDVILSPKNVLIPNIFLLRRPKTNDSPTHPPREDLIAIDDGRSVRIRTIVTPQFEWVFKAFTIQGAMERIRPAILRGLLARTYDLVRHDIPKRTIEVDYTTIEKAAKEADALLTLYGITVIGDSTHLNISHPKSLTKVGQELGYKGWHGADKLLQIIKEKTGIDIKASDNKYHVAVLAGASTPVHKYSPLVVDLLRGVKDNPNDPITLEGF